MELESISLVSTEIIWIALALGLGLLAKTITLPPLVGFLVTGFLLSAWGVESGDTLQQLADLGITLLLFTVGLKLNIKVLIRPQVWAVTLLHMAAISALIALLIFILVLLKLPLFATLDLKLTLLIAFALSFSSTVFVVKALSEAGEMGSLRGQIAIGILVVQDLAAVLFLAASTGKAPSPWALLLLLLIPLRPLLQALLQRVGHGELLILYALLLTFGGAELFTAVGIKGDLGALMMGVLISNHPKAKELANSILTFKELFLVGFFLSIGLSGHLTLEALLIGALLVTLIFIKSALFFALMIRFQLRARTSLLASLNLTNYSEFGLIVIALAVNNGWLSSDWLAVMAVTLALSFVISAPLNSYDDRLYNCFRSFWLTFQHPERLEDDRVLNTFGASVAVFGMGRVGSGAYDTMRSLHGETVVGIDFDEERVIKHQKLKRNVLHGDPCDTDFWEKVEENHAIKHVLLALPNLHANLAALQELNATAFGGYIASVAHFPDEVKQLKEAGATTVFNIYTEAGDGFANHV
ncbi:MAG: cation:proton antiporter, partial [Gammaproteobacteria bacterium]|nr:cation:proton antiporter [Gammaproteobacteria bacterium]